MSTLPGIPCRACGFSLILTALNTLQTQCSWRVNVCGLCSEEAMGRVVCIVGVSTVLPKQAKKWLSSFANEMSMLSVFALLPLELVMCFWPSHTFLELLSEICTQLQTCLLQCLNLTCHSGFTIGVGPDPLFCGDSVHAMHDVNQHCSSVSL